MAEMEPNATVQGQPSKRDNFRSRMSKRYPDLNMDDEDAYYDQAGKTLDEYEAYENNSRRLRESMKNSPAMQQMLLASQESDDFDPLIWMVKERGLDLDALQNDPNYMEKLSTAHAEYIEKLAKNKELEEEMQNNMPENLERIRSKASEMGLSDEQVKEVVGRMFTVMDNLIRGKINEEAFEYFAKGMNYDTAITDARAEGKAEGVNQRVDDRLRDISDKQEYAVASQTPQRPTPPRKQPRNMFLAGDEDLDE